MAYRNQRSDNGALDDSEQKFSWLSEEHDEEYALFHGALRSEALNDSSHLIIFAAVVSAPCS